jgi:hypothetical protein
MSAKPALAIWNEDSDGKPSSIMGRWIAKRGAPQSGTGAGADDVLSTRDILCSHPADDGEERTIMRESPADVAPESRTIAMPTPARALALARAEAEVAAEEIGPGTERTLWIPAVATPRPATAPPPAFVAPPIIAPPRAADLFSPSIPTHAWSVRRGYERPRSAVSTWMLAAAVTAFALASVLFAAVAL